MTAVFTTRDGGQWTVTPHRYLGDIAEMRRLAYRSWAKACELAESVDGYEVAPLWSVFDADQFDRPPGMRKRDRHRLNNWRARAAYFELEVLKVRALKAGGRLTADGASVRDLQ